MLMVVNKSNSMDGFALNNRPIPDTSHVEIASTISRLFKFIVQWNVKEAELYILQQIRVSVREMGSGGLRIKAQNEETLRTCVPRPSTYFNRSSMESFQNSPSAKSCGLDVSPRTVLIKSAMKFWSICYPSTGRG
jgi:hypothetical protein